MTVYKRWKTRIGIFIFTLCLLTTLLLIRSCNLLNKHKINGQNDHYCYIHSNHLKNKIARITYNQNNYKLTPFQKGLSLYHVDQMPTPLHVGSDYVLNNYQILDIGGILYRFKKMGNNQNVVICDERVEDFVRIGTSQPFYFSLGGGTCKIRDLIILPTTENFVSTLKKQSGKTINNGTRLIKVKPPLPDNQFLPYQTTGYRIESLFPNVISIERGATIIKDPNDEILQSGDILNFADILRIQFFLQKRMITETVTLDRSEKRFLSRLKSISVINRMNRKSYGVFIKLVRLNETIPDNMYLISNALLEPVIENQRNNLSHPISLVPQKENILLTIENNFSLFNPDGRIPDTYTDIQTVNLSNKAIEEKQLLLKGNIIEPLISHENNLPSLLKKNIQVWNDKAYPAGIMFWGNISNIPDHFIWLISHTFIPQKKGQKISSQWYCHQNKPDKWPKHNPTDKWKPVCLRRNKNPEFYHQFPPDDVNPQWIWDNLPWEPDQLKNKTQQRFFTCTFQLINTTVEPEKFQWHLISPANDIKVYLNGKKLSVISRGKPEELSHFWEINCPSNIIKQEGSNILAFALTCNPPNKSTSDNPGLQMKLSIDDNSFHTGHRSWEVSITEYLNWWENERKGQWLTEDSIYKEYTQTNHMKLLQKHSRLKESPVIWLNENSSINGKRTCFFRYPLFLRSIPQKASLTLYCSGSSTIYLNGKKFQLSPLRLNKINIKKYLRKGKQYVYIKIVHPGNDTKSFPLNAGFKIENNQLSHIDPQFLTYHNPFTIKQKRGNIEDVDHFSLPRLLVIKGDNFHIQTGDVIPLFQTQKAPDSAIKDFMILSKKCKVKEVMIAKLHVNSKKPEDTIDIQYQTTNKCVSVLNNVRKNKPSPYLYAPYSKHYSPINPEDYKDKFLQHGVWSGKEKGTFFPAPGKSTLLQFGREHLIYYFDELMVKEFFYTKNRNSFRTGQRILVDLRNMSAHEFLLDSDSEILLMDEINTMRIEYNKGNVFVLNIGEDKNLSVKIDGKTLKSRERIPLTNGKQLSFGPYIFKLELEPAGLLAKDIISGNQRYYAPGLGMSHTIGFHYRSWSGLENSFNDILSKGANVQLTIDDDLQRMARSEVLKEIQLLERKKKYRLAALKNVLDQEDNKIISNKLRTQMNTIKNNAISGALIILNQDGEILSAVSEPSLPMNLQSIEKAYKISQIDWDNNLLINKSLFQPQWSPGSSMKILTALAALEINQSNQWIKDLLSGNHYLQGENSGLLDSFKLPNGKEIHARLMNHNKNKILQEMSDLSGAIAKSYNVYFGYLGLLMCKTIMFDSNVLDGSNQFWWRSFADVSDRYNDYPLLRIAEIAGYNRYLNLMPCSQINNHKQKYLTSHLLSMPGIFPQINLNQKSITRNAIGQGQVKTTPLLNAIITLMIAKDGHLSKVSLIKKVYSEKGISRNNLYSFQPESKQVLKANTNLSFLKKGMKWVVNGKKPFSKDWEANKLSLKEFGTAVSTFDDSLIKQYVYGKTGTSEAGEDGLEGHSWFVCYIKAPDGNIYSIVAVFPYGGAGNRHAGECIKRVLNKMSRYYEWKF